MIGKRAVRTRQQPAYGSLSWRPNAVEIKIENDLTTSSFQGAEVGTSREIAADQFETLYRAKPNCTSVSEPTATTPDDGAQV